MLDSIIRSLSLTIIDADDPTTTLFPPGSVPMVDSPRPHRRPLENNVWFPDQTISPTLPEQIHQPPLPDPSVGCSCSSITLGEHWPMANDHAPMWGSTPAWNPNMSEAELRKESCRRLCWSSMILAAGHISYKTANQAQCLDLFISDPANVCSPSYLAAHRSLFLLLQYALLFSGESVARSPLLSAYSSKDTIWALHDRAFLLWHGCIRMRNNSSASDVDKSQFAVKTWLEADALEQALSRHACHIERAFIFQPREYIFK